MKTHMPSAGRRMSTKPHLRMQKIHLTGKSAFPAGPAALGPPMAGDPGAGGPAFDLGSSGAAGGDTGP